MFLIFGNRQLYLKLPRKKYYVVCNNAFLPSPDWTVFFIYKVLEKVNLDNVRSTFQYIGYALSSFVSFDISYPITLFSYFNQSEKR